MMPCNAIVCTFQYDPKKEFWKNFILPRAGTLTFASAKTGDKVGEKQTKDKEREREKTGRRAFGSNGFCPGDFLEGQFARKP